MKNLTASVLIPGGARLVILFQDVFFPILRQSEVSVKNIFTIIGGDILRVLIDVKIL
jgi:hypothetical protein